MNLKQRKALRISMAVFVLAAAFPPWKKIVDARQQFYTESPLGYAFILDPPRIENPQFGFEGVKLDFGRLFIGWIIVVAVAGCFIYELKEPKPKLDE